MLPTRCIYGYRKIVTVNSDYFVKYNWQIVFNKYTFMFLLGGDSIFKHLVHEICASGGGGVCVRWLFW